MARAVCLFRWPDSSSAGAGIRTPRGLDCEDVSNSLPVWVARIVGGSSTGGPPKEVQEVPGSQRRPQK
eukprot:496891-Pyramimonas_sp.AAC.1